MRLRSLPFQVYQSPQVKEIKPQAEVPTSRVDLPKDNQLWLLPPHPLILWKSGAFFPGIPRFIPNGPTSKPNPPFDETQNISFKQIELWLKRDVALGLQALRDQLNRTPDPQVQIDLLKLLPEANDPKIHLFLRKIALEHPNHEVRIEALLQLGNCQAWPLENLKVFLEAALREEHRQNQRYAQNSVEAFAKKENPSLAQNFLIQSFYEREGSFQENQQSKILVILSHWQNKKTKDLLLDILQNHSSDFLKQKALEILRDTFQSPHLQDLWFHVFSHTQDFDLKVQALQCSSPKKATRDWPVLLEIFRNPQAPVIFEALCQQIMVFDPDRGAKLLISSYQSETRQQSDKLRHHASLASWNPHSSPLAGNFHNPTSSRDPQYRLNSLVGALVQNGIQAEPVYRDFFARVPTDAPYKIKAYALWGLFLLADKESEEKIDLFFSGLDATEQIILVDNLLLHSPQALRDLKVLSRWLGKKIISQDPLPWLQALQGKQASKVIPSLIPELGILLCNPARASDHNAQELAANLLIQLFNGPDLNLSSQAKWQLQQALAQAKLSDDTRNSIEEALKLPPEQALKTELQNFLNDLKNPRLSVSLKKEKARRLFSQNALSPYQLRFEKTADDQSKNNWGEDPGDLIYEDEATVIQYFYIYQSVKSQLPTMTLLSEKIQATRPAEMRRQSGEIIPILIKKDFPGSSITEKEFKILREKGKQSKQFAIKNAQAYYSDFSIVFRRYLSPENLSSSLTFSLGHEAGHLLMHNLYGGLYPRTPGHSHDLLNTEALDDCTSPGSAWSEGFATFVSFLFTDPNSKNAPSYFINSHEMQGWSQTRTHKKQLSNEFVVASLLYSIASAKKIRDRFVPPQKLLGVPSAETLACFEAMTETMQYRGKQLRTHKDVQNFLEDFVKRYPEYHERTVAILRSYELAPWLER